MKFGLGQSYSKVDLLPKRLRGMLDLTKPASSLGAAGMFFFGSLFYFKLTGTPLSGSWDHIFFATLAVGLSHGASQAMNMAEDAKIDKQTPHKQDRPIPSGVVSEEDARALSWILIGIALGASYATEFIFGVFISIVCFFGVFYNLDPIRAKERIISIPWQATSRGLMSFPLIWAAYGNPFQLLPWTLGLFQFWYVLGFQNSADIIDRHVDEEYGISTFVVEFGLDNVYKIATGCMFLMVTTFYFGLELGIIPEVITPMLLIVLFCAMMLYYMYTKPESVSGITGNHPAWLWFYFGMVMAVLLPLLSVYFFGPP